MEKRSRRSCLVPLIAGLVTLTLAISCFVAQSLLTFDYDDIGYIVSTKHCTISYDSWGTTMSGTIDIRVYNTTEVDQHHELVNLTITAPSICAEERCCQDWVGKRCFFQISIENGVYTVLDISDSRIRYYPELIGLGVVLTLLGLFFVYIGAKILFEEWRQLKAGYKSVN